MVEWEKKSTNIPSLKKPKQVWKTPVINVVVKIK
jgi:hypothetical protein